MKKPMMLTKDKITPTNDAPYDERPVKGSNGHETYFQRVSTDIPKMAFVSQALDYAALV